MRGTIPELVSAAAAICGPEALETVLSAQICDSKKVSDHQAIVPMLGDAEIIKRIGDNHYLAGVNGIRCTAIFNFFIGVYYVDDVYGI